METLNERDERGPKARRLVELMKKLARRLSSPSGPGENLEDYDITNTSRTATFVMASAEGPRFVPGDVISSDDLIRDADELFAALDKE